MIHFKIGRVHVGLEGMLLRARLLPFVSNTL